MLERAKEVARDGGWARVEYARYADDLVTLVNGYRRHAWLRVAEVAFGSNLRDTIELTTIIIVQVTQSVPVRSGAHA